MVKFIQILAVSFWSVHAVQRERVIMKMVTLQI
jgi:hypothetical protein